MIKTTSVHAVSSIAASESAKSLCSPISILCTVIFISCSGGLYAQELNGYASDMPSVIYMKQNQSNTWWQNSLHNRLNFSWRFAKNISIETGMRNRLLAGSGDMLDPAEMNADKGWADLTWNIFSADRNANRLLLNTSFDRLHVTFEKDKWQIRLGRQRINWGQTLVWNPNDIFNTYSFFDFDYPERPGCDALRSTYYHSETASSELAVSVNHAGKTTAALLHHWNWRNFDYQIIAGEQTESDVILGGAWTGDFGGLNFRGEFSYFHPIGSFADTAGTVAVSVGVDCMLSGSLMLQAEALYNNSGNSSEGLTALYSAPLSAKKLSVCDWNVFAQVARPVTPRLNLALSGMYFVDVNSFYAGLTLDYSLVENLDMSFIAQYFATAENSAVGNMRFIMGFVRLKYSF
ncbi:MAG: hypothetical protein LBG92_10565 [Prevotellaceae bacterium]|jgi:hypothetical protein|nr:hypothetical protein [Prevotellaceae bacterium]